MGEEAYKAFLQALKTEAGPHLEVGMDVAGWGILKDLPVYAGAALDVYTSMTPTYDRQAALSPKGEAFVQAMASNFSQAAAAGIGSVTAASDRGTCAQMPDYGWSSDTLKQFLATIASKGISTVDVWRCDIDGYGETIGWFIDALASFLSGSLSSTKFV